MSGEPSWTWGRAATEAERAQVTTAAGAFRSIWATMTVPPWPAMFDGTPTDVRSLDYLAYEGFSRPVRGDSQAALVCGEVLRRMLGLHWVVSDSGGWFVASHGEATEVVICPLARLQELDVGGCPQFGRFGLWLTRALLDCQWLAAFTDLPTTLADAMDVDFLPGSADLIARLQRIATA